MVEPFSNVLMNVKGNCPNCGTQLTFMDSAQLAKNNGIKEDAVMCHNCHKVYTVNLTLDKMTFIDELKTNNYTEIKQDYAVSFKECIDNNDKSSASNLLETWKNESPNDANMHFAKLILEDNVSQTDYDDIKSNYKPANDSLKGWYELKAGEKIVVQPQNYQQQQQINNQPQFNNQQQFNQQPQYNQQQIPQNNYNNQQVSSKQGDEENSVFGILFYKKDKKTNQVRISKTKTISFLCFILLFIFFMVSLFSYSYYYDAADIVMNIIFSFVFAGLITIPVFVVGYLISYLIDNSSSNNNIQYNNQIPYQNQYNNVPQQNQQYTPNNPPVQNQQPISNQQNNPYQQPHISNQQGSNQQFDFTPRTNNNQNVTVPQNNSQPINDTKTEENKITADKKYLEKDNCGTRHDTVEKANAYWLGERFQMKIKPPFTLYMFDNPEDPKKALLELPYIHEASDTGNLICDNVFQFGYYKVNDNLYEAIVCGKDLTYEEFEQAEEAFKKYGGNRKNNLEPEKSIVKKESKSSGTGVKFRETINKNQGTYECYDAETKADALEFLRQKNVTQRLYYVCVYTPEGDYGKDIEGIYQM